MNLFKPTKPTIVYNADGKQVTLSPTEATPFDKSSIKRANYFSTIYSSNKEMAVLAFESGRYSVRGSMRLMARALKESCWCGSLHPGDICEACMAVNRVKANADWPLED